MMDDCTTISEMIPEYINQTATAQQRFDFVHHIASCPACRSDLKIWLAVNRFVQQTVSPYELQSAFDKIPDNETGFKTVMTAFDHIRDTFSAVELSYKFVNLL